MQHFAINSIWLSQFDASIPPIQASVSFFLSFQRRHLHCRNLPVSKPLNSTFLLLSVLDQLTRHGVGKHTHGFRYIYCITYISMCVCMYTEFSIVVVWIRLEGERIYLLWLAENNRKSIGRHIDRQTRRRRGREMSFSSFIHLLRLKLFNQQRFTCVNIY